MASGPADVPEVARELARYLTIAMTNSLRAAELAGLSMEAVHASGRADAPDVGLLHCAGSKGKHARLHHPFSIATSSSHQWLSNQTLFRFPCFLPQLLRY